MDNTQDSLNRSVNDIARRIYDAVNEALKVSLSGGDIQIGAVEIKDATTDNRMGVTEDGQGYVSQGASSAADDSIASYDGLSTAALSSVAQNAASVTLLAANANRSTCVIYNESSSELKIAYASSASATVYTYIIPAQSGATTFYFEMPKRYTGAISGIWAGAGAGNARITELSY